MKFKPFSVRPLATGFVLFCLALIVFAKDASALTVSVDQRCRVTSALMGSMSVTNRTDLLQQSYKPTQNRLNKISIYMEGDGVGSVTLWLVQDSESGTYYINSNGPVAEPNGKGMMDFVFDNVVLIPGEDYIILPNPTDNSKLNWFYQDNCYADGIGYMGQVANSFDFAFQTSGYTANQAPQQTDNLFIPTATLTVAPTSTVTPTATVTKTANQIDSPTATITVEPTGMGTGEMGIGLVEPTTSITPIIDVDPEIPLPEVEYVLKNLEKIENLEEAIELSKTDGFVLYGTGEKNSTILISLGQNNYETVVSSNGTWYLQLPLSEIDPGTYTIKGQTQFDGNGGNIAGLATIRLQEEKTIGLINELSEKTQNNYPYIAAILVILIGLTLLGMYLDGRKKANKIIEQKPVTGSENPGAETPSTAPEGK